MIAVHPSSPHVGRSTCFARLIAVLSFASGALVASGQVASAGGSGLELWTATFSVLRGRRGTRFQE